jgi:hypothetical protein
VPITRVLDNNYADSIAREVCAILSDTGYSDTEIVPGLIRLVVIIADSAPNEWLRESILDEAASLLADC